MAPEGDDCPLPPAVQFRNILCFAGFWCVYYLAAPVVYVGIPHANLLKELKNTDFVANLPHSFYQFLSVFPVLIAWMFPRPRHVKPMSLTAIVALMLVTGGVAGALWADVSPRVATLMVILHGVIFGAANGVLITALWDMLRRGVSTSRRGLALGLTFGVGPLFACLGAVCQDMLWDGPLYRQLLVWAGRDPALHSLHLESPQNFMVLFAAVVPLLTGAGVCLALFTVPAVPDPPLELPPLREISEGLREFLGNRIVVLAVVAYILVYSGGNAILDNASLHAREILKTTSQSNDTQGLQSLLRFSFKAVTGVFLGWLLTRTNPRATLLATTTILLVGMIWALSVSGWPFLITFGLLGSGELFGAYFPNYVATATRKPHVRSNMAYLSVFSALIGFAPLGFGKISDLYQDPIAGRMASFVVATGILLVAMVLICLTLPKDPTPKEEGF